MGKLLGFLALALAFPAAAVAQQAAAQAVSVQPYQSVATHPQGDAPATVLSLNDARVSAQIAATVTAVPVRVGDEVNRGDLLVSLDCADYHSAQTQAQASLDAADARLTFARYQLKRARSLAADNNVSEELLNQREADARALLAQRNGADAALALARHNVERCRVEAPFDGLVTARLVSEGDQAAAGTPLVQLLDRGRLEVSAQVPEGEAGELSAARDLVFVAQGQTYPLTLRVVAPAVDSRTRNREVRLLFTERSALPGSAGRLRWQSPLPHLPAELVLRRGAEYGVFVLEQGKARFKVLPGAEEGRPAVTELPAQTPIIVQGRYSLQDGDPVQTSP